jgi:hypothetical protein
VKLLAIDPGTTMTAYVIIDTNTRCPIQFDKIKNDALYKMIFDYYNNSYDEMVIEMIASYGMRVGSEVFETCVAIGRLEAIAEMQNKPHHRIGRIDVKRNLTGRTTSKDKDIIAALTARYGCKGTKASPGQLYGFYGDIWSAYAVGITWIDMREGRYTQKTKSTPTKRRKPPKNVCTLAPTSHQRNPYDNDL